MSGFEVLGVILGIYPIIANTLSVYRSTKRGGASRGFLRSLEVEQVIFGEFVHNLLAAELSESDLANLRDGNSSELDIWSNKGLYSKVERRLGTKRAEVVLSTLRDINDLLKTLRQAIEDISVTEQGEFKNYNRIQGRLQTFKQNLPQSNIKQGLAELNTYNGILQRLLCDRVIHVFTPPRRDASPQIVYLQRDSSHAVDLYHALYSSFLCDCTKPHPANLGVCRLVYDINERTKQTLGEWDRNGQFELLFSLEDDSDDTDVLQMSWSSITRSELSEQNNAVRGRRRMSSISIQECPASKPLNPQNSIDDFCTFVKGFEYDPTVAKTSLNLFSSREKNYLISMRSPKSNADAPPFILCAEDYLKGDQSPLPREDRIELAMRLSHAVLQFYSTPWIDDHWTWRNFALIKEGRTVDGKYDTTQLFVARNFYSASKLAERTNNSDGATQAALSFTWSEPILTRLGFALIELALGARFADLRSRNLPQLKKLVPPNLNNAWMNAEILDRETARLFVDSGLIRREEGQAYEDAVKACLEGQYIHDSIVRGLKSNGPSFLEDVERCILEPLYHVWEKSWGKA